MVASKTALLSLSSNAKITQVFKKGSLCQLKISAERFKGLAVFSIQKEALSTF